MDQEEENKDKDKLNIRYLGNDDCLYNSSSWLHSPKLIDPLVIGRSSSSLNSLSLSFVSQQSFHQPPSSQSQVQTHIQPPLLPKHSLISATSLKTLTASLTSSSFKSPLTSSSSTISFPSYSHSSSSSISDQDISDILHSDHQCNISNQPSDSIDSLERFSDTSSFDSDGHSNSCVNSLKPNFSFLSSPFNSNSSFISSSLLSHSYQPISLLSSSSSLLSNISKKNYLLEKSQSLSSPSYTFLVDENKNNLNFHLPQSLSKTSLSNNLRNAERNIKKHEPHTFYNRNNNKYPYSTSSSSKSQSHSSSSASSSYSFDEKNHQSRESSIISSPSSPSSSTLHHTQPIKMNNILRQTEPSLSSPTTSTMTDTSTISVPPSSYNNHANQSRHPAPPPPLSLHYYPESSPFSQMKSLKVISSKYDFVKVKVYLSDEHYYILSRFLISRVLTATQVQYRHSIRMALDLKKLFVDQGRLDVTQEEMENELFKLMKVYHYGENNIQLYRVMSRLHHLRVPIIILLAGTAYFDKSMIATRLAECLNLPCVMKTDLILELISPFHGLDSLSSIYQKEESEEEEDKNEFSSGVMNILESYTHESKLVLEALNVDLTKYCSEGKSFIVEGLHVEENYYKKVLSTLEQFNKTGIVVPFLLTIDSPQQHLDVVRELVETTLPYPSVVSEERVEHIYSNSQMIQALLISQSRDFISIQLDRNNLSGSVQRMHEIVLQRIIEVFESLKIP